MAGINNLISLVCLAEVADPSDFTQPDRLERKRANVARSTTCTYNLYAQENKRTENRSLHCTPPLLAPRNYRAPSNPPCPSIGPFVYGFPRHLSVAEESSLFCVTLNIVYRIGKFRVEYQEAQLRPAELYFATLVSFEGRHSSGEAC